jgi:hypothetical protein
LSALERHPTSLPSRPAAALLHGIARCPKARRCEILAPLLTVVDEALIPMEQHIPAAEIVELAFTQAFSFEITWVLVH